MASVFLSTKGGVAFVLYSEKGVAFVLLYIKGNMASVFLSSEGMSKRRGLCFL